MVTSTIFLAIIGAIAAALLYAASKRFYVKEDPRVVEVESVLPGANCGGCGYSGCHAFAEACAAATSLSNLRCVAMPAEDMVDVARIVGLTPPEGGPKRVALLRCSNDCDTRDVKNRYDGVRRCSIESALYQGETECLYGCLGCGDCVDQCRFDAMRLDPDSGLPVVDFDKCTACGACAAVCPRDIIEITEIREGHPFTFVACNNKDRGSAAMKACKVSCIGCGICRKTCRHDAVSIGNFLAHIDQAACVGCGECAEKCPRHSIVILENAMSNEEQDHKE